MKKEKVKSKKVVWKHQWLTKLAQTTQESWGSCHLLGDSQDCVHAKSLELCPKMTHLEVGWLV